MKKAKFQIKKMVFKGAKYTAIFILPILIDRFIVSYPEYAQLTLGGVLVMLSNYAKIKLGVKL